MKVRCSNGLQVSSYHGNFLQHNFGADLEFGVIDADKAIGVMFSYDGKLDAKLDAHFQCALLYTTASGERRVRCTNTVAGVSEGAIESMRFIDQDAVVGMIAKEGKRRRQYASAVALAAADNKCSCNKDDRASAQRYPQCSHRKVDRYSCWLPKDWLGIPPSRSARTARKSQRIQHVHPRPDKVSSVQSWPRTLRPPNTYHAPTQIHVASGAITLPLPSHPTYTQPFTGLRLP